MRNLLWLPERLLLDVTRPTEHAWNFSFDGEVNLHVECLWRLLLKNTLLATSQDDGQLFGLEHPVDATALALQHLKGRRVREAQMDDCSIDLRILFQGGNQLQLIPTSSGYEAWQLVNKDTWIVGHGGFITAAARRSLNEPIVPDLSYLLSEYEGLRKSGGSGAELRRRIDGCLAAVTPDLLVSHRQRLAAIDSANMTRTPPPS